MTIASTSVPFPPTIHARFLTLSSSQMFKYVLYRSLQTTTNVFSKSNPPAPAKCREIVDEYNRRAKQVWECEGREFFERQADCETIQEELFSGFCTLPSYTDFQPVPGFVVMELSAIFRRHYTSNRTYLLFGRTDNDALEVQDGYGLSVASVLEKLDWRYEAQAHLYLRKMYGKGAPLPLLTLASASAMWHACSSYYYRQQIAMVSLTVAPS